MKNLISSNLYSKEELNRLEQQAILLSQMEKSKSDRRLKKAVRISYVFLISLLGFIVYLSFILEIPKIQLFSGF